MMSHTAPARLSRLCLQTAFLILALLPFWFVTRPAVVSARAEQSISTHYFTIFYPDGEEKTAQWYASFADDVDTSVSELLGSEPVEGMTLRIYASEADYQQANPIAGLHPGVLAHAIPEQREVGVAVERLRQQPPALARESFRHEMTHIVAGALSNQNLPIAFQEGLAQYNELSSTRGAEVARSLEMAKAANVPLLSWSDLSIIDKFRQRLNLSYPQSYTVMAFLADRYGMGPFSRFLEELAKGIYYQDALNMAYGKPIGALEAEWKEYLPSFTVEGYKHNVLAASDMAPAVALYQSGRFKDAEAFFAQSEQLFTGLGRTQRATEASANRAKASTAQGASALSKNARAALEHHDYAGAQRDAATATQEFASLDLTNWRDQSAETQMLAQRGLEAITGMERAKSYRESFRLSDAQNEAREAGQTFALLADKERVAEANSLLADIWSLQRMAGMSAIGAGAAAVAVGALSALRVGRRARRKSTTGIREETVSWL